MRNGKIGSGIMYKDLLTRRENGLTINGNGFKTSNLNTSANTNESTLNLKGISNWKHSYKRL